MAAGEKLPFDKIVYCNIGNPQQLKQPPITFFRQVLSLVQCPWLLEDEGLLGVFPKDAIERARLITSKFPSSIGGYSHSKGHKFVREDVARFIEARDGIPADPEHIFLTDGASEGIKRVLGCIVRDETSGIMLPIPQYPLYSATLTLLGGKIVPYYLDEGDNWSLKIEELERSLDDARLAGIDVRALCLINPGNPTGNHLTQSDLLAVAQFCVKERLALLADEVYQSNIYGNRPFTSMKKIVCDAGLPVELFSFHSTSKGFLGECGRRGGYFECYGIQPEIIDELYKLASVSLCPNVDGQLMVDLMVSPPLPGDESYERYCADIDGIRSSLTRRALKLTAALNQLEGVQCQQPAGAMYLFPRLVFPDAFLSEADLVGRHPDELYCLQLLEATGICTVPGSGFGQKEGTYHIRMTFLPPEDQFDQFIDLLTQFHSRFVSFYKN